MGKRLRVLVYTLLVLLTLATSFLAIMLLLIQEWLGLLLATCFVTFLSYCICCINGSISTNASKGLNKSDSSKSEKE